MISTYMNKWKWVVPIGLTAACIFLGGCKKSTHSTSGNEPVSTSSDGPVELKIKWKAGKQYDEQLTMVRTNFLKRPGVDKPTPLRSGTIEEYAISVLKELPEGGTKMEFTILREKFNGMGMAQLNFDSDQDPQLDKGNPFAPTYRAIIGAKFTCDLDGNGNPGDVSGMDEFYAHLPTQDPQILDTVKQTINSDVLQQRLMQQQDMPPAAVKIGDHWPKQREVTAGMVGKLALKTQYTFKGWQQHEGRKCALIEFVGEFATRPGTLPDGPVHVSVEKGEMSGSAWLDPDLQMFVGSAIDQKMKLKIEVQGRAMDGNMTQRMETKLLNVTDIAK